MKRILHVVAVLSLSANLTGCVTYSLEELRHAELKGSDFHKALARMYLDFASSEEKEYDWFDSMYFADKGLKAAYGKDTAPEDLKGWDIPKDILPEMESTRAMLLETLTPQTIAAHPEMAARAQFMFDCWAEQQEENWQVDDIAHCRDGVKDALKELGVTKSEPSPAPKKAEEKAEAPKEVIAPQTEQAVEAEEVVIEEPGLEDEHNAVDEVMLADTAQETAQEAAYIPVTAPGTEVYVLFFESSQVAIPVSGKRIIDEVIRAVEPFESYEIVLNGHTDTKGDEKDNLKISLLRAEAVKARLVEGGVKESAIKVIAYGETDLRVKTADNVAEPANQRVEILLSE